MKFVGPVAAALAQGSGRVSLQRPHQRRGSAADGRDGFDGPRDHSLFYSADVDVRPVAVIALVIVAYHQSLVSLARELLLQTPLAFVALVPIIALLLAWIVAERAEPAVAINDRQVDYIIGIGLLLLAATVIGLGPLSLNERFWVHRVELLSLPIYTGGLVSLFYGVRRLWTLRWPLTFLVLAWPTLYVPLVGEAGQRLSDVSLSLIVLTSGIVSWASPVEALSPDVFAVRHGSAPFLVSISAPGYAINSLVGFAVLGTATSPVLRGTILRRLSWLTAGLILVFTLNVLGMYGMLAAGAVLGPHATLAILHPAAGAVVVGLALPSIVLLARSFGLSLLVASPRNVWPPHASPSPVRRNRGAVAVGLVTAIAFAGVNSGAPTYDETFLAPLDTSSTQWVR